MKKFVLLCLIFPCLAAGANEMTEDYFDIASSYAVFGQYKEAITYIDKILQIEPQNSKIQDVKAVLTRITNPATKSYLTTTDKNIKEAQNFKKQGNSSKQIDTLSNAQNDFWSLYSLAEFYRDTGDFQNAIFYYQKASALKPAYSQSYLGLAIAYKEIRDYTKSLDAINKYLTYNKESDIAFAVRAETNLHLNNITEAEKDIKQALEIEENISYLLIEAKILYAKGDYEEAREKFQLLSKNIQTSEVYKYLGLCDYSLNSLSSALLNIDKAIILSNEDKELNDKYNEIKSMLDKQ